MTWNPGLVRPVRRALAGALATATLIGGGAWWLAADASAVEDALRAVPVRRDTLEELVTAQGKLEAKQYVDVGSQVSGQLRKIHVQIGDRVAAGELLAEIDPRVYESQVQANEARLASLRAQLGEQQAQLALAEQSLARNRKLIEADAISLQALQESEAETAVAKARIRATQAQIGEVFSDLAGIRTNLGFTKILAPLTGTVTTLLAREGQTLNANQTAPVLLQISDLGTMTVRAQVAEADVMRLRAELPAYFTTLGDPDQRWEGSVRQILPSPQVVNDVVLYDVLIDVGNESGRLMTGMSTQVFFVLGRAADVAVIPSEALVARVPEADGAKGRAYRVRVEGEPRAQERLIHTGLNTRAYVEVTDGLREGERVLLRQVERSAPANPPRVAGGRGGGRRGGFGGGPQL